MKNNTILPIAISQHSFPLKKERKNQQQDSTALLIVFVQRQGWCFGYSSQMLSFLVIFKWRLLFGALFKFKNATFAKEKKKRRGKASPFLCALCSSSAGEYSGTINARPPLHNTQKDHARLKNWLTQSNTYPCSNEPNLTTNYREPIRLCLLLYSLRESVLCTLL